VAPRHRFGRRPLDRVGATIRERESSRSHRPPNCRCRPSSPPSSSSGRAWLISRGRASSCASCRRTCPARCCCVRCFRCTSTWRGCTWPPVAPSGEPNRTGQSEARRSSTVGSRPRDCLGFWASRNREPIGPTQLLVSPLEPKSVERESPVYNRHVLPGPPSHEIKTVSTALGERASRAGGGRHPFAAARTVPPLPQTPTLSPPRPPQALRWHSPSRRTYLFSAPAPSFRTPLPNIPLA